MQYLLPRLIHQQLRQAIRRARPFQKLMLDQLLRTRSTPDIHTKTHAQKSLQILTQLLRVLKSRRSIRRNQIQRLKWLLIKIRRLSLNHLNSHDSQGPDIDLWAVFFLLDDFRRHPVGCSDHSCALGFRFGELGAEAEVGDFDVAAGVEENVVGFDIAVDNVLLVEVVKAEAGLGIVSFYCREEI